MQPIHPVIGLARPLPSGFMQGLQSFGEVWVAQAGHTPPATLRIWVSSALDPVNAELIDSLPASLGLIANIGVGYDNIDLQAARKRGIAVSNTPVVTEDTADLAWALLLSACRRLSASERFLREGRWAEGDSPPLGQRVHGRTLGIVGLGSIGQAVARRASGFGMRLMYHAPRRKPALEQALGISYCSTLEQLLERSDILSLHCPLNQHTRHLLNAERLALMKPGSVLINTGRGALIDEQALVDALRHGRPAAAGLDVFEHEPQLTAGLAALANVTLLPHIGSATGECRQDMALRLLANIRHFLANGAPLDRVSLPPAGEPA